MAAKAKTTRKPAARKITRAAKSKTTARKAIAK